ncbi:unnamed protein product [Didymodactylos carnosus]|uniref:Uncharacterized protein n=1 Tax=Didymodactylos carnosus TaxID=1234261 RepID=A0A814BHL6_9BILA|nr:unnamed protein product [Didymodactylos carnosus]CAF0928495.1 unnamed protein product [Didymodactylos carnosus]CAF3690012.1 unnamed protein product [Didymodactylos carnosus]CAF3706846.1 unnamed protein product [Didymodactylos carnosus]
MQERAHTLPLFSLSRNVHNQSSMPPDSNINNNNNDNFDDPSRSQQVFDSASNSTPELNLLLDKLTEILRFRSRRHLLTSHHHHSQHTSGDKSGTFSSSSSSLATAAVTGGGGTTGTVLKRLQSGSVEPLDDRLTRTIYHNAGVSSMNSSSHSASASYYSHQTQQKSSSLSSTQSRRTDMTSGINEKTKRRLPSLLQRLIDEGNLIKEAVRRLKTQRFTPQFKQTTPSSTPNHNQQQPTNQTPTKINNILQQKQQMPPPRQPPCCLTPNTQNGIMIPNQLSDPPTQTTSSPSRFSWIPSAVFGLTSSNSSGSGSPLRSCFSHDRTPMEIGGCGGPISITGGQEYQ